MKGLQIEVGSSVILFCIFLAACLTKKWPWLVCFVWLSVVLMHSEHTVSARLLPLRNTQH